MFVYNRGKRTLGMCDFTRKRIELSRYFVAHNDEAAVRDPLLHEIAHALAGEKAGHGPKWRRVCERIGAVTLPALVIHWWNLDTEELKRVELPLVKLLVEQGAALGLSRFLVRDMVIGQARVRLLVGSPPA